MASIAYRWRKVQGKRKSTKPCRSLSISVSRRKILSYAVPPYPTANPAERIAVESEEKARPAYEKALRPFHRLRAFSELEEGKKNTFPAKELAKNQTEAQRKRVRFGKEEQQNERALTFEKSRSKRYVACSDVYQGKKYTF